MLTGGPDGLADRVAQRLRLGQDSSFFSVLFSIWRIRSRVTPNARPTSSSVHGWLAVQAEAELDHLALALGQRRRARARCPRGGATARPSRTATRPGRPRRSRRARSPPPRRSASRARSGCCAIRRISRTSSVVISSSSAISSGARLAAEPLDELALDVDDLVQLLDHVHRDADRARLVGDRARDRLPDPPGRVGRELVALAVVELLDRADQAERALLDQVEEREPAAQVALRDRDDEAEVRLDHLRLRGHVAALDPLRQVDLLVGGEQRHLADLAQVEPQRVERRLDREVELRRASPPRRAAARAAAACAARPRRARCRGRSGRCRSPRPAPW